MPWTVAAASSRTRRFLPNLPLLYSNTVLRGESRKLLRLVVKKLVSPVTSVTGGEGGIRTLGTGVSPYNGLANRRIRPLCHLSATICISLPRREELPLPPDYERWKCEEMCFSQPTPSPSFARRASTDMQFLDVQLRSAWSLTRRTKQFGRSCPGRVVLRYQAEISVVR